jgi:translation initiation factor 1A
MKSCYINYYITTLPTIKMVKNAGGNKAKRQARKYNVPSAAREKLRLAIEDGEIYACVQKLYGNGRCGVVGIDGKEYMCRIGGKFSGRSMRDNLIAVGTWLLVGLREWESGDKRRNCDVLEVYSAIEAERLRSTVYENWAAFGGAMAAATVAKSTDEVMFSDYDPAAAAKLLTAEDLEYENEPTIGAADDNTIVNIDDI